MFGYLILGVIAFAYADLSWAGQECGTYPQAVYEQTISAGWSDCDLKDVGEQPLWQNRLTQQSQVTRFVFTEGHGSFFRYVTITEFPDGTGELKTGGSDRGRRAHAARRSRLSSQQISNLNLLGAQSGAWEFDIGSWDGDEIYLHCQFLEMEKANSGGYRYSSVNIGCNHPPKLMPLVFEVARLARLKIVNGGRLFQ